MALNNRNMTRYGLMMAFVLVYIVWIVESIKLESSINVEWKGNVKLKLANGQMLIGNRKIVNLNYDDSERGDGEDDDEDERIEHPPPRQADRRRIVYEFLGVPFAKAPVLEKRFQFPHRLDNILPAERYNATYWRPSCYQEYDLTFMGFRGSEMWNPPHGVSEDCLFFNVWVPVTKEQDDLMYKKETLGNLNTEWRINHIPNAFKSGSRSLKSSLFWIYGGSFNSGSANLNITDGTLFAALEGVILVTFNYRVGPFGFLYLNNSQAPGNAGLADQVMVIEWYREHYMDYFGADPDSICLFGESAGAMSLHYLMFTTKANLFKRLIFQSSSSYSDLTYRPPLDAYKVSLKLAQKTGCLVLNYDNRTSSSDIMDETPLNIRRNRDKQNIASRKEPKIYQKYNDLPKLDDFNKELVSCLLNVNSNDLSVNQFEIDYVNDYLKMQFIPTADFHNLVTKDPNEIDFSNADADARARLNHDVLAGINRDEGTYFAFYFYNGVYFDLDGFINKNNKDKYNNEFVYKRLLEIFRTKYPPADDADLNVKSIDYKITTFNKISIVNLKRDSRKLNANRGDEAKTTEYFYRKFINCLSNLYSSYDRDLENNRANKPLVAWNKITKIIGDYIFSCPTIKLATNYSNLNANRSYFYKFNKRSKTNPWPLWTGVLHGYEIEYIFGVPWLQASQFDTDDRFVSRKVMNYWSNFAKYGKLYSEYETQPARKYLVLFSPGGNFTEGIAPPHTAPSKREDVEYELFNRNYDNCDYLNSLNRYQSYADKYEMCLNYKDEMLKMATQQYGLSSSSFTSSSSSSSIFNSLLFNRFYSPLFVSVFFSIYYFTLNVFSI